MRTLFASHNGGVANTAVAPAHSAGLEPNGKRAPAPGPVKGSAVGGQLGRITTAIGLVGWNEYKVPAGERVVT